MERTYWTETHTTGTGSKRHTHTTHHGGEVCSVGLDCCWFSWAATARAGANPKACRRRCCLQVLLLNAMQPLACPRGGALAPGQYQWAIVFALPPGVPSSFQIGAGSAG